MTKGITLIILTLLSIFYSNLYGATFTVTSNADSGTGTLREALTLAAANGNASVDLIKFNLPGLTPADHIIRIRTELPTINTDVIIDGSTQPGQNAAINGAKVIIEGRSYAFDPARDRTLFRIINVGRFELYGIVIKDFLDFELDTGDYPVYISMLYFFGINQKVVIGGPGKGNVIYNTGGIYCPEDFRISNKPQIHDLVMKSNFIGIKENGIDIATEVVPLIRAFRTFRAEIGGPTLEEGNLIYGEFGISYLEKDETINENIVCTIRNNTFCANKDGDNQGNEDRYGIHGVVLSADRASVNNGSATFKIQDNVFGSYLSMGGLGNVDVTISRNFFGTSRDKSKTLSLPSTALRVAGMNGRVLIGGSSVAEGNVITNTGNHPIRPSEIYAVFSEDVNNVELSHNTFYCNPGIAFIYAYTGPFKKPLEVFLKEKTPTYVAGTTKPGARVELFYTDPECTNCQPKRYFATVTADNSGKWKYDGIVESGVSVMASATLNQISSEFSDPRVYMFPYNEPFFIITHQTCDSPNGTIKGAFTVNVDKIEWLDEAGNVVGNTLDMENLPAGKYRIRANQFGCIVYSEEVIVENNIPQLAFSGLPNILHESCGKGGSILNLYPNYYSKLEWINKAGVVVGDYRELEGVPAGEYRLKLTGLEGSGCVKEFGPYVIKHVNPPTINDNAVQLTNMSCIAPTGSIKNLQVTGTGTIIYTWHDANGNEMGHSKDIDNLPEGTYTLNITDESACGIVQSAAFTIENTSKIELDDQNVVITPSACNGRTGTIKGITFSGASLFKWLNQNNVTVGNSVDLTGAPAGTYRLVISNALGCSKESQSYTIPVATTVYPDYRIITVPATCGRLNGSINIDFGSETKPDQIRITDQSNVLAGTTASVTNLKPGNYKIYFAKNGACESFYRQIEVTQIPGLLIQMNGLVVTGDNCGQAKGAISGISISGGTPPYAYTWLENNSGKTFSSLDLGNLRAGSYRLTVKDQNGCEEATTQIDLQNSSAYVASPQTDPITACPGTTVNVIIKNKQTSLGIYNLYKGSGSYPVASSQTGSFAIVAEPDSEYYLSYKIGECESERVPVKLTLEGISVKVPNSFSPNGDGINDDWQIQNMDKYPQALITVFNRYGQKVFSSVGYNRPFDGKKQGSDLPVGTYYYIIDMKGRCGTLTGSLTILR